MAGADAPPLTAASGIEDWRRLVEAGLRGRDFASLRSQTRDGIVVEPLYERRRDRAPIWTRGGRPWAVVQPLDHADPDQANDQARADVAGGATSLSIRFAQPNAGSGLPLSSEALQAALDGIDLAETRLRLEPHPSLFESAIWLSELVLESGIAAELSHVAFGLDPAVLVDKPGFPGQARFAALFDHLRKLRFGGPLVTMDARVFHEAGASEAQELAGFLAIGAWWIRTLADTKTASPAEAMKHLGASLSVDRDLLLSLAKLRAARLLWARLQDVCGVARFPLELHAETSRRMLSAVDPDTNMLRNMLAAFAAAGGGADSILVHPHTAASGPPDGSARALARNTQNLLIAESDLCPASDAAAESGAIEALTDALAERGWAEFQAIEREGGILESIRSGAFPTRVATARRALAAEISSGRNPLVGATVYQVGSSSLTNAQAANPDGAFPPITLEAMAKAAA
jgi:methylmalonyl-CoA mutase